MESVHPQWSKRMIDRFINKKHVFDSTRILKEAFSGSVSYCTPSQWRVAYESIMINGIDQYEIDDMAYYKKGAISIDFSKDIELISRELKLFYYVNIAGNLAFNARLANEEQNNKRRKTLNRKIADAYDDLAEWKARELSAIKRFKELQFNTNRAIGLFLWDCVYRSEFKQGSFKKSIDLISKAMPVQDSKEDQKPSKKPSYCDDVTLRALFEQTHLQIITREFKLMKAEKTKT